MAIAPRVMGAGVGSPPLQSPARVRGLHLSTHSPPCCLNGSLQGRLRLRAAGTAATGLSSQRELGRFVPCFTSDSQSRPAARRSAAFGAADPELYTHVGLFRSRPTGLNSTPLFEKTGRIPGFTVW